ncbi:MAG: hypothetical protein V2A54_10550 [Bacteroidota bacterium]
MDIPGHYYFTAGMGAYKPDGTPVPNGWNWQPAPLVVIPALKFYRTAMIVIANLQTE